MARTVAEVIASARPTLDDADGVRYPNSELIGFTVDALNQAKNMRPDLFVGQYGTSIGTLTTGSNLPIDEQFFRPIVDYVIARCETKDDEHVTSARVAMMQAFSSAFLVS